MRPVAILGGTFNPVHHGHLRIALEAKERLGLESVRMIPLFAPPHREPPSVSADLRLAMLEVAVDGEPGLIVDDREIRRQGCSYTVDTLRQLREELEQVPICLLLGTDSFMHLHTWHQWEQLSELAHIVVLSRPGVELSCDTAVQAKIAGSDTDNPDDLHKKASGYWMSLSIPLLEISSTQIRNILHNEHSARYLLPDAVLKIIQQQELYTKL